MKIVSYLKMAKAAMAETLVDVDKLYTSDNIVVLRLLYPYRIITLASYSLKKWHFRI